MRKANQSRQVSFYKDSFEGGAFVRPPTRFREWVKADGSTRFVPEPGRYHLYVSSACPWSHRTMILRKHRGLESVISMSVTDPIWNERGWTFGDDPDTIPDTVNGKKDLIDLYLAADPAFDEEETVPVLWDRKHATIVNNESLEIMRMFDVEFSRFAAPGTLLYPVELAARVDETIGRIYGPINDGVYKAGFALTQDAYERAVGELFTELDHWDRVLGTQRYLCGDQLTEADVALYVTLVRFDVVYYSHFKTNLRRIADYANLWDYLRALYQIPAFRETTNFRHIKAHYYGSHRNLNPSGIVPVGPILDFDEPARRGSR